MKLFISTLLIFVIFLFSCARDQSEIKVMTFNIRLDIQSDGENSWETRKPIVAAYMDSVAPDISGMQEVLHHQLVDLQNMMPGYSFVGTGRDDGKSGGEYSPIFFRDDRFILHDHSQFWLSESPDMPGSISWDAAYTRIVSWAELENTISGDILYVFNTHFDHRGMEARRKSIELISEKIPDIKGNSRVIFLGDFNIRKTSDEYEFLTHVFSENHQLANAELISQSPVKDAESTFNGFGLDTEPRIIDYIFVDDSFEVLSYRVDQVMEDGIFISDHWPVVSEIFVSR